MTDEQTRALVLTQDGRIDVIGRWSIAQLLAVSNWIAELFAKSEIMQGNPPSPEQPPAPQP